MSKYEKRMSEKLDRMKKEVECWVDGKTPGPGRIIDKYIIERRGKLNETNLPTM